MPTLMRNVIYLFFDMLLVPHGGTSTVKMLQLKLQKHSDAVLTHVGNDVDAVQLVQCRMLTPSALIVVIKALYYQEHIALVNLPVMEYLMHKTAMLEDAIAPDETFLAAELFEEKATCGHPVRRDASWAASMKVGMWRMDNQAQHWTAHDASNNKDTEEHIVGPACHVQYPALV